MALEVSRKPTIKHEPQARTTSTTGTTADRKTNTKPTATAVAAVTSTSNPTDTSVSRPTLQTSLDSRRRFGVDSGATQRSFMLNRQLDRTGQPGSTEPGAQPPVGAVAAVDRNPRVRSLRLADDGAAGPAAATPAAAAPAGGPTSQVDTGEEAIAVLDRDFDKFDTANEGGDPDGDVSDDDLRAVSENKGGGFTQEQQDAARVLLDSTAYRSFADVGAGRGRVDGNISREDVTGAQAAIASGSYYDELMDTAAGRGGRDGNVSRDDIVAGLSDPGISQEGKDALNLMLLSSEGSENFHGSLQNLTATEVKDASALYRSPELTGLSGSDKQLAADAFRDSGGSSAVSNELRTLIQSEDFKGASAEEKTSELARIAVLNSTEFAALPASDQDLVRQTLDNADPTDYAMPGAMKHLLEDPNFASLSAEEKTSILSQGRNYPDSRSIVNMDRMVDQDWFQDQSTEDKQRSTKLVAHLSQHDGGDREITENTLDRFLSNDADYRLEWKDIPAEGGNVTFGYADGDTLTLNSNMVGADNNRVAAGNETSVIENTTAHEVSHLVNGDSTNQTFEYLNEEYRAWYVGYEAEHGRPPSNQEAMDRWEYFLNPDGGYADYAHGVDAGWPFGIGDKDGALDKPEEANQIYALLSQLSGVEVTADNYQDIMADPSKWTTNPNDPASDDVFPDSDDLDN